MTTRNTAQGMGRAAPDARGASSSPRSGGNGARRRAHLPAASVRQPYYSDDSVTLYAGHALEISREFAAGAVDCIVTSPPRFGVEDCGIEGGYGAEHSPAEYVENMRTLFFELGRALADDGTLWLSLGDSGAASGKAPSARHGNRPVAGRGRRSARRLGSAGESASRSAGDELPAKNRIGVASRVVLALQDDGWILRSSVVWSEASATSGSVSAHPSGRHEHLFQFTKPQASSQKARDQRQASGSSRQDRPAPFSAGDFVTSDEGCTPESAWTFPPHPVPAAQFAVMPPALAQQCVLSGCRPGGIVLDPFSGSGTTGLAAQRSGRRYVGIDLNPAHLELSLRTRLRDAALVFEEGA